jgi:hypothetical protein
MLQQSGKGRTGAGFGRSPQLTTLKAAGVNASSEGKCCLGPISLVGCLEQAQRVGAIGGDGQEACRQKASR